MKNEGVPVKKIFFLFLSWRFLLLLVAFLSSKILTLRSDYLGKEFAGLSALSFLWPWANFDGAHYLSIVTSGYGQFEYAFFPGYPFLIFLFSRLWPDPLAVSFLLSNLLTVVFLVIFYKLCRLDFSHAVSFKAILLILIFPGSFFLGAVYGEGLFLTLTAGAILAARMKRMWVASALTALASFTRLVGVFLVPVMLLLWWRGDRKARDLWPIIFSGVGFAAVLIFNFLKTGDPLYFVHVQPLFGAERSGGDLILLPQVLFRYVKIFLTVDPLTLPFFSAWQEFTLVILVLSALLFGRKKVSFPYLLFSFGVLILPTLTGTLSSMPRYIVAAFPVFIVGAQILRSNRWFWLTVLLFLIWQIVNVSLFTNGYWVS